MSVYLLSNFTINRILYLPKAIQLMPRHTQTKTTQNAVRPKSSNKRSRNLLKFENKFRFPVHTTTRLSFHHVYHVRCRLLLRAGSSSKYVHHVFATSSIRQYNSHCDLSTFLSRLHCVRPAKYSDFC